MLIIYITSQSTCFFYPLGMSLRRRFWPFGLERFVYEPRLKKQLETLCLSYKPSFIFLSKAPLREFFFIYRYYSGILNRLSLSAYIPVFMHVGLMFFVPLTHYRFRLRVFFCVLQVLLLCLWVHIFIYFDVMNQFLAGLKKQSEVFAYQPFLQHKKEAPFLLGQVMSLKLPIISLYFDSHQIILLMQHDDSALIRLKYWLSKVSHITYSLQKKESNKWCLDVVW